MSKKGWGIMILAGVLILTQAVITEAGNKNVGTSGAQFLKIGVGGRPTGMGSAYAGIADDVNAIYWNPGGLAQIQGKQLTAMYNSWFEDISHQYLGYAQPIGEKAAFGLGITYLTVGDMEKRTADTTSNIGTFDATDMALALSYGRSISDKFMAGLNLKYISQKLEDESATGYACDLGSLYKATDALSIGLVVQNIGSKMEFISEGDPLPLNIKLGFGYKLLGDALTLGLDVNCPNDNDINIASGLEYNIAFGDNIAIAPRAGFTNASDLGGLQAGIGIDIKKFGVDIAYAPYEDLGNTYKVALLVKF